jgi:hypothetical protein
MKSSTAAETPRTKRIVTIPPSRFEEGTDNFISDLLRIEVTTAAAASAWFQTNGRAVGITPGSREEAVLDTMCAIVMTLQQAGIDCAREEVLQAVRLAFGYAMAGLHPHPADRGGTEWEDPHGLAL